VSDSHDDDHAARMRALEERLARHRDQAEPPRHQESHYSQAQVAWRMVIELVAGLGIGFGVGYGLDTLFGTMPIFLIPFIFFGLAAGVKTMLRTAKELQVKQQAEQAGDDEG
jgi:ATP synthase protein I